MGFNLQQTNGLVPQPTGFPQFQQQPNLAGYPGFQQQQPTGLQPSIQQALVDGQQAGSPFADPQIRSFPPQPTGFSNSISPPLQTQPTGINTFLPPALVPQPTSTLPPNQFQSTFSPPPVPPIPQNQQPLQPLVPQKTGPPPPVRFGVNNAQKKLAPQPTGRKANLAQASKFLKCPVKMSEVANDDYSPAESIWFLNAA